MFAEAGLLFSGLRPDRRFKRQLAGRYTSTAKATALPDFPGAVRQPNWRAYEVQEENGGKPAFVKQA